MFSLAKKSSACAILLFSVVSVFSTSASAQDKEVTTWRVTTHQSMASPNWEDSFVRIKNKLEERTGGRLKLDLYPVDSLFGASEIYDAVKRGIIPMAMTSPAYMTDKISTATIAFGLPGAFQDVASAAYFLKQQGVEEIIREEVAEDGMYFAADKVYPSELLLTGPVESLSDFENMKIRVAGLSQTFITEVGGAGSYIPGTEVYQALTTGVFDGASWGAVQEARNMGFYEVAKYRVAEPLLVGIIEAWLINKEAMEKLPEDVQEIVKDTLEEHFWIRTNEHIYKDKVALKEVKEELGVETIELPQEVKDKMREVAIKLWDKEAEKSDNAAKAVDIMKSNLSETGELK
jgi:TRAP-type C4-dicarboxylate transport system substrate-binding protein